MSKLLRTARVFIVLALALAWAVAFATPAYASWTKPMIASGEYHAVGLKSDGSTLWSGQLQSDWDQIPSQAWTDIVAVAAGESHTVGLKSDGTVVAAGSYWGDQTATKSWTDVVAIAAGRYHNVGLKVNGTVVADGVYGSHLAAIQSWTGIIAVAAGEFHTVGLKSDGTVVAAGSNGYGQMNVGSWTDIVAIAAGRYHTVGLKSDGTVVAVGINSSGQLNVGSWADITAIAADWNHTVGLRSNGAVVAAGPNNNVTNVGFWTNVDAIAVGVNRTFGVNSDGSVRVTGASLFGGTTVSSWNLGPMTPPAYPYSVTLPSSQIVLDFASVTDEGISSATAAASPVAAPAGLRILSGGCWQIASSAAFTGNVAVTVPYNAGDLQGASESSVELYQYVSPGVWQRVTSSVDTVNNTVTGTVTSLGIFAVMAPAPAAPEAPVVRVPAASGWSLAVICVAGLGIAAVSRRRSQGAQD